MKIHARRAATRRELSNFLLGIDDPSSLVYCFDILIYYIYYFCVHGARFSHGFSSRPPVLAGDYLLCVDHAQRLGRHLGQYSECNQWGGHGFNEPPQRGGHGINEPPERGGHGINEPPQRGG